MSEGTQEHTPLLQNENIPNYNINGDADFSGQPHFTQSTSIQTIEPEELPPPYQETDQGGSGMRVVCQVCQAMIDVSSKSIYISVCKRCNEATPIGNAPSGKCYVRCPCNCLLICKSTSQRISCPRPSCKRILTLDPISTPPASYQPGFSRIRCGYCSEHYFLNTATNNLAIARCPHCRKLTSVGPEFARGRCTSSFIFAIVFLLLGVGVTAGTYVHAVDGGGLFFVYIGPIILSLICFLRCAFYCTMKVSVIEGPL